MGPELVLAGLLQGLLEWLPVSSSGQVTLFYAAILGVPPDLALARAYASHIGTALSGVVVTWDRITIALRSTRWLKVILVPTLAAGPVGFALINFSVSLPGDLLNIVLGASFIATAAVLGFAGGVGGWRRPVDLTTGDLVLVGVVEGLAAVPGLSRSGLTLAALLALRVEPREAVALTILLGVPVTAAAGVLEASSLPLADSLVLGVSSFASGLLGAGFMLGLAEKARGSLALLLAVLGLIVLVLSAPALI